MYVIHLFRTSISSNECDGALFCYLRFMNTAEYFNIQSRMILAHKLLEFVSQTKLWYIRHTHIFSFELLQQVSQNYLYVCRSSILEVYR